MALIPNISQTGSLDFAGVLVFCQAAYLFSTNGNRLTRSIEERGSFIWTLILCIFYIWWIGSRPFHGYGDTLNYYVGYQAGIDRGAGEIIVNFGAEWVWSALTIICLNSGLDATGYFTVIAAGYMLSATWAMKKFLPTSPYMGFLFLISSLFFVSFGVNGLRNGLACHILMLAMAFLMEDKRIIAGVLAVIAMGIHRSTMLPIAATIAGLTVIRDPRYAFYIWLASIPLSLAAGGTFTSFLAGLGIDDRMASYAQGYDDGQYIRAGFRWDFLIYSAAGVIFYWFVCLKRKKRDGWYNLIATTYLLANAVWVLVIRIEYSNRFAYLSWFLIPVLIAYPLCNMKAWGSGQDSTAGFILLCYWAFSFLMYTFIW